MKTLILILSTLFVVSICAQNNTISVKKKASVKTKNSVSGLYYSPYVAEEIKTHNRGTTFKQVRHYAYFINNKEVFLFTSSLSPKKVAKKLNKKGIQLADEYGQYSLSENDMYFEVKTTHPKHSKTYRYVARMVNEKIYLSYKAAYREKTALDIYLYKYVEPVGI